MSPRRVLSGRVGVRPRFPLGPPTWPGGVPRPPIEKRTGVHYDTDWARKWPARVARAVIVDDVLRPAAHLLTWPQVHGVDRLDSLEGPAIFAANHNSHIDTTLLLASLPSKWRHRTAVAAAADYFFTSRMRGAISALSIGAIPMDRQKVGRRSADLAADLLDDGWSLVIFPEGGRSPDGWAQDFRGGAAYLSLRCGRPVVPVYIDGTRRVWKRGQSLPSPMGRAERVHVVFGSPIWPGTAGGGPVTATATGDESVNSAQARRFAARIEAGVFALADEHHTDWWTARRNAAKGSTPGLGGPDAAAWRRAWALVPARRGPGRSWP